MPRRSSERAAQQGTLADAREDSERAQEPSKATSSATKQVDAGVRAAQNKQRSLAQAIARSDRSAQAEADTRRAQDSEQDGVTEIAPAPELVLGQISDEKAGVALAKEQLQAQMAQETPQLAVEPSTSLLAASGDPAVQIPLQADQTDSASAGNVLEAFVQLTGAQENKNTATGDISGDAASAAGVQAATMPSGAGIVPQVSVTTAGNAQATDASLTSGAVGSATSSGTQVNLLADLRATTAKLDHEAALGETASAPATGIVPEKQGASAKAGAAFGADHTEAMQKKSGEAKAETSEARFSDALMQRAEAPVSPPAGSPVASGALLTSAGDSALDTRQGAVPESRPTPINAVPMEIGFRALQGHKRFDIRLDPGDLGRVDVRLEIGDDGAVSARLTVDRVETLHLLQRDAKSLEYAFEQAGLKPSDSSVDIQLRDRSMDFGGSQNRQQPDDIPQRMIRAAIADDEAETALHPATTRIHRASTRGVDIVI